MEFKVSTSNCGQKPYTKNAATVIFVKLLEEREPQHSHYELCSQHYLLPLTESLSCVSEDSLKYAKVNDSCKEVNDARINNPLSLSLKGLHSRYLCSIFVINWLYQLNALTNIFKTFCKHLSVENKQCNGAEEIKDNCRLPYHPLNKIRAEE